MRRRGGRPLIHEARLSEIPSTCASLASDVAGLGGQRYQRVRSELPSGIAGASPHFALLGMLMVAPAISPPSLSLENFSNLDFPAVLALVLRKEAVVKPSSGALVVLAQAQRDVAAAGHGVDMADGLALGQFPG